MGESSDTDVRFGVLLTDPALVAVFLISGVVAFGVNAVPVALPRIGTTFHLTESEIGLVMTAFAGSVLVALPVVSVLADLYGRRRVVIPSLVLIGLSGVVALWTASYPALLVLRVAQGVGFAGTLPLTPTLIGDLYTETEGSTAQGIRAGVNGLAGAVAPLVAGLVAALAWQYAFLLFVLALPAAVVVYWAYPEPSLDRDESHETLVAELRAYLAAIRTAADRRFATLVTGGFVIFFLKGGFKTFLPVFVVAGLGDTAAAGTMLGVYGGARVVVAPFAGAVLARLGRRYTIVVGMGVAAVGMAAVPFATNLVLVGAATASYSLGESILNPVINDAVAVLATGDQRAGIMSGLQMFKELGLTVAPVAMGALIAATGFTTAFGLSAALAAAYALVAAVRFPASAQSEA